MDPFRPTILALLLPALAALGADGPAQAPGWAREHSDVSVSPRVTFGQLENGLRYALLPDRTPPGQVSLRLLVLAGSLDERDDELGYAHFVEHMAFRSTRSFPADEKVKFLQGLGVSFGPHINAETTFTRTVYRLDLPENSAATLEGALRIMRDFADGVSFEASELDHERGVVLSESLARHTPDHDRDVARFEFVFGGTKIPQRWPIGTEASIKRAGRAGLRSFYDAWYRPERMVVVIAGDIDPSGVAPQVRSIFATVAARAPRRAAPALGALAPSGALSARFASDTRNGIQVELGSMRVEAASPDTEKSRLDSLSLDMASDMLGRRLRHLTDEPGRPIAAFSIGNEHPFGRLHSLSVVTVGDNANWTTVVATAEQELRRAIDHGFDASELSTEKESLRSRVRERAQSMATAAPATLADALVDDVEQGNVFTLPDERMGRVLENMDRINAEGCRVALRDAWDGYPRYLFVTAHAHLIRLSEERILAAYRASQAVAVAPAAVLKQVTFAYDNFGPPGQVVQREHVPDLDLWLVRFANGVRLNLKRTDFEHRFARVSVRVGSGRLDEPPDKPGLLVWAGAAVGFGGLRQYSDDELDRALGGVHFDITMGASSEAFQIGGSSAVEEFPLLLRRIAATVTDSAFRAEGDSRLSAFRNDSYLNLELSESGVIAEQINPFLAGGDLRLGIPSRARSQRYTMEALGAALGPMLRSGSLEIALVGDFDVDQVIAQVARTFGALPARDSRPEPGDRAKLSFPRPPQSRSFDYRTGTKDRPTTLLLCWPVNEPISQAERLRLELLAHILQDRLRVQIRVEKGETYSPSASFTWDDAFPGYSRLSCQLEVKSARAKDLDGVVRELAASLGRQGVTPEELERARAQSLSNVRRLRTDNAYWLFSVLADAQEHPSRLDEARGLERESASATASEIDALAARYLAEKNLFEFTIRPVYSTGLTLMDRLRSASAPP